MNGVTLDQYKGTEIEKAFKEREDAIVKARIDVFLKGKKCSAKKRKCIEGVMASGKSEESAWGICTASVGE